MYTQAALAALTLLSGATAQLVGTNTAEVHPKLTVQKCTKSGGCVTSTQSIVLDANWRWVHNSAGYTNCYDGNTWNPTYCPDPVTCVKNCALDGADYSGTYGITTSGSALTLSFVTGTNVGSRVYLMDSTDSKYEEFDLRNKEFTFTVDMSTLPCGLNGALYFSEMAADGGMSTQPNNKAGAKYGTGYCDSQCPHDIKFINGEANSVGWVGTTANSGKGEYGACCNEMDIWEANINDAAYTPHVCDNPGLTRTTTNICDQGGCDFNSFRMGQQSYLGPGLTIDTLKPITVITQFVTADNTNTGALSEIRRLYVQNGVVIQNSNTNIAGMPVYNSISDAYCADEATAFAGTDVQASKGGLAAMGSAFSRGMVLVLSIWDDTAVNMLWLDSDYPTNVPASNAGVHRGNCSTTSGDAKTVEAAGAGVKVVYSAIKWGEIGSTFTGGAYIAPAKGPSSSSTSVAPPKTTTTTVAPPKTTTTTTTVSVAPPKTTTTTVAPPKTTTTTVAPPKTTTTTTTTTVKPTTTTTTTTTTSAAPPSASCATKYGQCGGIGWAGAKCCAAGSTCQTSNAYYSQCL